jgi:hypothetical protein
MNKGIQWDLMGDCNPVEWDFIGFYGDFHGQNPRQNLDIERIYPLVS